MKKTIAWLLALVLTVTCLLPAASAAASENGVAIQNSGARVVVLLSGDGETIYDKDGNKLFRFADLLSLVNASTCLFPDFTWFTKNIAHSDWTSMENALLYTVVTADRQYTADEMCVARFTVKDKTSGEIVPMTADNCNTESWDVQENAPGLKGCVQRLQRYFKALITWFKYLFRYLKTK